MGRQRALEPRRQPVPQAPASAVAADAHGVAALIGAAQHHLARIRLAAAIQANSILRADELGAGGTALASEAALARPAFDALAMAGDASAVGAKGAAGAPNLPA